MSAEPKAWHVGIAGVSPRGLFLLEQMSLEPLIHLVGAFDPKPERSELARSSGCRVWNEISSVVNSDETDIILFADGYTEQDIAQALNHGKHVVLDCPWQLTSAALRRLSESARRLQRRATTTHHHRWSSTFLSPLAAKEHLGPLSTVHYASCEQGVPGVEPGRGVLREFGYDLLDQLCLLVPGKPRTIVARQFADQQTSTEHGLLVVIEFSSNCIAQIELQTRSRLSYCTGWMLEGRDASYRGGRIYNTTADGEIIDEAVSVTPPPANAFLQELVSHWEGTFTKLPTLDDAAELVELIETIEQSANSN